MKKITKAGCSVGLDVKLCEIISGACMYTCIIMSVCVCEGVCVFMLLCVCVCVCVCVHMLHVIIHRTLESSPCNHVQPGYSC